jgi:tetratricopeptide (TPR) repeat protein
VSGAAFQIELTPEALPLRTDLARFPFAVLLANARMLGVTGILELRGEKRIFISRGSPVHVESDLADETSELYLLRTGAVDASDLAPARELARSQGGKIGEALLGLGLIEANELFEHTRNRARDGLVSCFQWETGTAVWEPRERFGPDILAIPIDAVRVFFDGILRYYDRRRLDRELPVDDSSRIYLVPSPRIEVSTASVGTVEARLLKLAQGRPSLPSAGLAVGLSPDDLRRRVYALYCLGVIGFEVDTPLLEHTPPPNAPPPVSMHVPRAGTGGGGTGPYPAQSAATASSVVASTPATTRAPSHTPSYVPAARPAVDAPRSSSLPPPPRPVTSPRQSQLPPPPTVGRPSSPSVPPPPTVGRSSSPSVPPPARDSQLPPPPSAHAAPGRAAAQGPSHKAAAQIIKVGRPTKTVSAYVEDAELARGSSDWDAALLALEYALELEPENPYIWGEKAYTLMLRDPRTHGKEANTLAREARRQDASLPLPYVVLGMLMEQIRETERAVQMYRVALQKDPICEPAQARLEALEVRRR